jgi:pimeloyl-ACP methyl ester carboxylesterase
LLYLPAMGFLNLPGLGRVHYHEYGSGAKPLLAFHGYGMTGRQFHVLEKSILKEYHVYGFDHFFHGESTLTGWTEQQIIAGMPKIMVKAYLEAWFQQFGRQRISLMAYSIGANFALLLVEEFGEYINEVILMAPDGLAVYKGFHFLTHQPVGKNLFRWVSKSNWLAPAVLKGLKRVKFIDESLYRIAYNEVDTEKKRLDVYYTLNLIKQLRPDAEKVAEQINEHHIKCQLIFGKQDLLFPLAPAQPFISKLLQPEVHEVNMGHWLVTPELDEYLANYNRA